MARRPCENRLLAGLAGGPLDRQAGGDSGAGASRLRGAGLGLSGMAQSLCFPGQLPSHLFPAQRWQGTQCG